MPILILCFASVAASQAFNPLLDSSEPAGRSGSRPALPPFALEERYRELSETGKRLQEEREELAIAIEQAEAALEGVQKMELALAEAQQALAELKQAAVEVRGPLKAGSGAPGSLNRITTRIYAFLEPIEAPDRMLQSRLNLYSPGRLNATPAQSAVTDLVSAELSAFFRRRRATEAFPAMGRLLSNMDFGADRARAAPTLEEMDNLVREIDQTDKARMEAVFKESRAAAAGTLGDLKDKLAKEKSLKDAKWRQIQPELGRVGESLRHQNEQRDALDKGLVWAIYGMIFALLLLFIGLRFFPADTASKLIEHRSLVEIISMAFILLTIIILGTGDKLGKETLGTLLGTIAGYIFGQKMGAQGRGKEG